MSFFMVDARYEGLFRPLGLTTPRAVMAHFGGEAVVRSSEVIVQPVSLVLPGDEVLSVFLKQYCFPSPSGRFWLRASKARREFENYAVFERLHIPCARRIACGERRDKFGRLCHAFILTRAVPNTATLLDFFREGRSLPPAVRATLRRQLADMTRQIHEAGFFHNDLYWRNVLVESPPDRVPQLCWIDCPRGSLALWAHTRRRRRIKDLAALDLSAVDQSSRAERVRFVRDYLRQAKLDEAAKKLIRDVVAYRRRRWPRTHLDAPAS
jgi:hypothetical protein